MIYTIGHSTLDQDGFLKVIEPVDLVMDVRSHPSSKWPQFRKENLEVWLPAAGKDYAWEPALGGWDVRHADWLEPMAHRGVNLAPYLKGKFPKQAISMDRGIDPDRPSWTNSGLYDYSWFMTLTEFLEAANRLIELGREKNVGIMCCEVLWWKCHRSMIADYLAFRGVECYHLQPKLTSHSKVLSNRLDRYHPDVIALWKTM